MQCKGDMAAARLDWLVGLATGWWQGNWGWLVGLAPVERGTLWSPPTQTPVERGAPCRLLTRPLSNEERLRAPPLGA